MKNEGEIRWIQLSDLHMFDSTKYERQKKALWKFNKTTDFVVITGDLHQYGTDYSMTLSFLNEMVRKLDIEKKDIIIVPGNHDISTFDNRDKFIKAIDQGIEYNEDVYRTEIEQLYSAFGEYEKFLKKFYGNIVTEMNFLKNGMYIWDNKLAIVCINTALISDKNHFKPQIIDIYELEKIKDKKYPCIAIMHHDYYSISDMHKPYIDIRFRELGVSATLSGHKHRYSKSMIDLGDDKIIPNFCCAKSISQPGDSWSDIGIIEYRWNLKENKVLVIPYQWNDFNLFFVPTIKFESQKNMIVDDSGNITLKRSFDLIYCSEDKQQCITIERENEKVVETIDDFEKFYEDIQKDYIDKILEAIGKSDEKFKKAINIMERLITYKGNKVNFSQIIDFIVSCKNKEVLTISGLQGTGKSTFLSLVYYELKKRIDETNIFPILIDLHVLDNKYKKTRAKDILKKDLIRIDELIKKYHDKKFILIVDGTDDYIRKIPDLEDILYRYIDKNNMSNFAFCIGKADNLPNEMCRASKLQVFSKKSVHKLETHKIKKSDDDTLSTIIKNLITIYSFSIKQSDIAIIKRVINMYTINEIDYRTLLIVLRVCEGNMDNMFDYQLGGYFYKYYLIEMGGEEIKLYKHAEVAYQYVILKQQKGLSSLSYTKIIYNNGITIDFLLAYYFVSLIKNDSNDLIAILKSNFVFTASVNKFIKDLILNKYSSEQIEIVEKIIKSYDIAHMSMKSQICYMLGRIEENNAKEKAKKFLIDKWECLYNDLFKDDKLKLISEDIKSELVLFRTISVSLIWLGYDKNQEKFLRCVLLNEKLNQINRGFHLEYYEDKAFMNGVSPTYVDDKSISVDKTMNYFINNINKGFSKLGKFNKSIYLDIVTLFSIYQYRMEDKQIRLKYKDRLINIAEKVLQSSEIQSKTIINYITTVKKLLSDNPYKDFIDEIYLSKSIEREGWVRRGVSKVESIADHMYGCYILGMFFLPDNVHQCIDYNIPDIENYSAYSKELILKMLLLHDLAEVQIGDIITPEKQLSEQKKENSCFDYYEFLCSFPYVYGLGNQKKIWDEFVGNTSINAKIANDFDKIEPVVQAYIYKNRGNEINLDEWKDYALKNVNTSLGKQFLCFVINKIIVQENELSEDS